MTDVPGRFLLIGLAALVWFTALARGAQDLWAVSVLCGWLSLLTWTFVYARYKDHQRIVLPLARPLTALFLGILISSRYSFDIGTTRLEITGLACGLISFFLFCNLFQDRTTRKKILSYAGSVTFPLAAIAALQYFRDAPSLGSELRLLGSVSRSHWNAPSIFTNSALLAGFSLSWILLAWHHRKEGLYYQWLFATCALNLFLARSWWAYISLPVGFMYYYKYMDKNVPAKRFRSLVLLAPLTLFVLALLAKFGPGRDPLYTADARLGWWIAGIRMFLAHPWVGVGLGAYGTAFPFFKPLVAQNTLYAHSFPVQIISEIGLIGLVGILLLVGISWRQLSAQNPSTREDQAYRATLLMLLTFSVATLFTDYFIAKLMLLLVLALAVSSSPFERYSISASGVRWAAVILIFLIPSWYLPFHSSQYDVWGLKYELDGKSAEAETSFRKALALNPYEDDSCRGLSRLYRNRYVERRSVLDLSASLMWVRDAYRLKKVPPSYSEKTK